MSAVIVLRRSRTINSLLIFQSRTVGSADRPSRVPDRFVGEDGAETMSDRRFHASNPESLDIPDVDWMDSQTITSVSEHHSRAAHG
jgi:hypothetical protein